MLHWDWFGLRRIHCRHNSRMYRYRKSYRSKLLRAHNISISFCNELGKKFGGHRTDFYCREHFALSRWAYWNCVRFERWNWRRMDHDWTERKVVSKVHRRSFLQYVFAGSGESLIYNKSNFNFNLL